MMNQFIWLNIQLPSPIPTAIFPNDKSVLIYELTNIITAENLNQSSLILKVLDCHIDNVFFLQYSPSLYVILIYVLYYKSVEHLMSQNMKPLLTSYCVCKYLKRCYANYPLSQLSPQANIVWTCYRIMCRTISCSFSSTQTMN